MRQATIEAGGCYAERFRSANYIQFQKYMGITWSQHVG